MLRNFCKVAAEIWELQQKGYLAGDPLRVVISYLYREKEMKNYSIICCFMPISWAFLNLTKISE